MSKVRYYEDVEVGEEFISPTRTITETDVVNYAYLSGDWFELHTSEEWARSGPFGQRVAHGLLGLSICDGLKHRIPDGEFAALASLGWTWDFRAPIFFGDTIHVRMRLRDKRLTKTQGRGIFFLAVELLNQRGEIVQEGEHKLLVETRDALQKAHG